MPENNMPKTDLESDALEDATTALLVGGRRGNDTVNMESDDAAIDWGGHEDEILRAREAKSRLDNPAINGATTEPIPNPADFTTRIMQGGPAMQPVDADARGHTRRLDDIPESQENDTGEVGRQADDEPEARVSQEAAETDTAGRESKAERDKQGRAPRPRTPLVIGALAVAIVALIALGLPALQDYLDSQRDATFTVSYVDSRTGESIAEPVELTQKNRAHITMEAAEFEGYQLASASIKTNGEESRASDPTALGFTLDADSEQDAIFAYTKLVDYRVRYLNRDGDGALAEEKTESSLLSGTEVTERAPAIDGYDLDSEAEAAITLDNDDDKNVITFYYKKTPEPEPVYTAPVSTYTAPSSNKSSGGSSKKYEKSDGDWT